MEVQHGPATVIESELYVHYTSLYGKGQRVMIKSQETCRFHRTNQPTRIGEMDKRHVDFVKNALHFMDTSLSQIRRCFFIFSKRGGVSLKRLYSLLVTILLLGGLLAACGNGEDVNLVDEQAENVEKEADVESDFPVTLEDATGEEVVIEKKPEKTVSLIPSNTEIMYAVGAGDTVVGVSEHDDYPKEASDKERVAGMELNIEKIIALDPDLVLAHASGIGMWDAGLQQLKDSGITVVVVHNAESFVEVYDTIEMIGKATGHLEQATELVSDMKATLEELREKAATVTEDQQKTVFLEVAPAPEIYTSGKDTFMDEMLNIVNAKNAVEQEGWPQMNEEAIIQLNPDVIITTYNTENAVEKVLGREGWQEVTAVKEKQVFTVDESLVSRSGPRIIEGVEEFAKAIYPDIFKE